MSNIYDEESIIEDLNIEADRVIAMNPSGIIENFENFENVNGKKVRCDGNSCVILEDSNELDCVNGICENKSKSYSKYIMYFVIFLMLCVLAYIFYKKYKGCDS